MAREHRCLVLTADGVPVARVSPERALVLVMQNKAYVIDVQGDAVYHSKYESWPVPAIIGLTRYYKLPGHFYGAARLSVNTLLRRDNWTCQYCGRTKHKLKKNEFLTRDHVFPVSRGGEDRWENVVLACNTCNNKKSDMTPEEAGLTLLRPPFAPTRWQLNRRFMSTLQDLVDGNITTEEAIENDDGLSWDYDNPQEEV